MLNEEQPGPGWWQGTDGEWYLPTSYPQAKALYEAPGPNRAPLGRSHQRTFRQWAKSVQGTISMAVGIATLSAGSAVIVTNSGPGHIRHSVPVVSITATDAAKAVRPAAAGAAEVGTPLAGERG